MDCLSGCCYLLLFKYTRENATVVCISVLQIYLPENWYLLNYSTRKLVSVKLLVSSLYSTNMVAESGYQMPASSVEHLLDVVIFSLLLSGVLSSLRVNGVVLDTTLLATGSGYVRENPCPHHEGGNLQHRHPRCILLIILTRQGRKRP